ncbi:MAG: GTPase domain-containing protein [Desulfobacterales bacterium]
MKEDSMTPFDQYQEPLARLRDLVPRLVELLEIEDAVSGAAWKNLDARLLPLLDPRLPLMVAICGGANSGKSTLFNSLLKTRLSVVRGNAGSTRRVLVAGHPAVLAREDLIAALFDPFGQHPRPLEDPAELLDPGPPLFIAHADVPRGQILMDTPDFDTGTQERYTNRDIAREVLEACNVLIYIVTNTTYNNLENTRFMRRVLTETGLRRCILVYNCSRTLSDSQVRDHLSVTATNLYGPARDDYLIGTYRTDTSDAVAAGDEFMTLRAVRQNDPAILDLLAGLDPRVIREQQIQTLLTAFRKHVRRVIAAAEITRDEIDLYGGVLQLSIVHAVQQSLVAFPLKRIMQRMNDIWLETSPSHLKFFRGVGRVIGTPARMIYSMVRMARGENGAAAEGNTAAADTLELIKSNLLAGASELRDKILAQEVIAETIAKEAEGRRLSALVDRIRMKGGRDQNELPSRHVSAATGTVIFHAAAPDCTRGSRKQVEDRPWSATAEKIVATAPEILNIAEDAALNRELTGLVEYFRRQMNFRQKTRESFFASLNVLPATLGMAYILTTGDPVGGSGIYAKLQGMFGMHDLWALVSIPASAGLDETGRQRLSDMLEPVVKKWVENRALIVRQLFEETLSGVVTRQVEETSATVDGLLKRIEAELTPFT